MINNKEDFLRAFLPEDIKNINLVEALLNNPYHKDAKLNLAKQIAAIALCLLKNNDKYNENYGAHLKERKKLRLELYNQTL